MQVFISGCIRMYRYEYLLVLAPPQIARGGACPSRTALHRAQVQASSGTRRESLLCFLFAKILLYAVSVSSTARIRKSRHGAYRCQSPGCPSLSYLCRHWRLVMRLRRLQVVGSGYFDTLRLASTASYSINTPASPCQASLALPPSPYLLRPWIRTRRPQSHPHLILSSLSSHSFTPLPSPLSSTSSSTRRLFYSTYRHH